MLQEFTSIYTKHSWFRCITWMGLLSAALFLFWVADGFPPLAWLIFVRTLLQFPRQWYIHGAPALYNLVTVLFISLLWLVCWGTLGRSCFLLGRYHWRSYHNKHSSAWTHWSPSQPLARSNRGGLPPKRERTVVLPAGGVDNMMPRPHFSRDRDVCSQLSLVGQAPQTAPAVRHILQEVPTRPGIASPTPGSSQLSLQPLEVSVGWHTGIKRKRDPNEDSLAVLHGICTYHEQLVPFGLVVVADGMGGHACGSEASHLAIQSMMQAVLQNIVATDELTNESLIRVLVEGAEWANQAVHQRAMEWDNNMGTTLTAALVVGHKAFIANIGDSRTYLYRKGMPLRQITRDHSYVASLVARGEITAEQMYTHPERNIVYRCLGTNDAVEVDTFVADLYPRDLLLLCSDGLWEMVRNPEIEAILNSGDDLTCMSDRLVQAALRGGGIDNVSLIVARVL